MQNEGILNSEVEMTFYEFNQRFPSEMAAIDHFINVRYAGKSPVCPHCGGTTGIYRNKKRPRYYCCSGCKNSFSVFSGTIFEKTKMDIRKWFYTINIFLNDKKGVSACNLRRELGSTYRTAWRMLHQIRKAMENVDMTKAFSSIVEVDETYVGGKGRKGDPRGRGTKKIPVVGVKERHSKRVYAEVMHPDSDGKKLTGMQLLTVINKVTVHRTTVITDDFKAYNILEWPIFGHLTVNHSAKEYSAGSGIHTNNIENFWSIVKRSYIGVYHKMSKKYLQRYVGEACYRANNRDNPEAFNQVLRQGVMPEANRAWRVNVGF